MSRPSLSEELAGFVVDVKAADIPPAVWDDARWRLVDWLGVAVAGSRFDTSRAVVELAAEAGGAAQATVLVDGRKLPVQVAGEVNAITAQATDYDDFHGRSTVHATAVAAPAALAAAEYAGAGGSDLLLALLAGAEVGVRINSATPPQRFHERGLHGTGMAGPFIAAAVTAKLLGLDARKTAAALGLAGSQSAGLLQGAIDGSSVKQLHPGLAVHAGIKLALLAGRGVTGPREVLEGRFGYYRSFLYGDDALLQPDEVSHGLGAEWSYPASAYKTLPTGAMNQASLEAVLALVTEAGCAPGDVERIDCFVPPPWIDVVCEPRAAKLAPASAYHVNFSLPYCVAITVLRGTLRAEDYSDQTRTDPVIAELAARVFCHPDPQLSAALMGARVRLTTRDGRALTHEVPAMLGTEDRRPAPADHARKFLTNVEPTLGADGAAQLLSRARGLADSDDVGGLVSATVPAGH